MPVGAAPVGAAEACAGIAATGEAEFQYGSGKFAFVNNAQKPVVEDVGAFAGGTGFESTGRGAGVF